jgi:O-antigen/teichoic acid export membrane protein
MLVWYVPFIVLTYTDGSEAVGYFTAGDQLISAFIAIVGWYFYSIYPTLVKTQKDPVVVQNYSTRIVMGIMTPACIGCILLAEQIMVFIFGEAYLPGVNLFILLTVSLWFLCLNQVYIFGLFSFDKQVLTTRIFMIQSVGTVILCLVLIPLFGAVGAALAAIGCELVALPLFHWQFSKAVKVEFFWILSRTGIASLAMVLAILWLQMIVDNLFLSIAVGAVVYMTAAYWMKFITKEEILKLTHRGATGS